MTEFSRLIETLSDDELSRVYASHMDAGQGMAHARKPEDRALLLSKLIIINRELGKRGQ
jgi:hypothetical protein